MKLVIENVAPGGPAHAVIIDGKSYPVISCTPDGDGMTETYELEGETATPVVNVHVQSTGAPGICEAELGRQIRQTLVRHRLGL